MKKLIIFLIVVLTAATSYAQIQQKKSADIQDNNTQSNQNNDVSVYRLFPTQNIWNFIKLNTRNGLMWQVQFDIKENNRFQNILNLSPLVTEKEEKNGRFTLYPTQNIYTFILLDQLNGKTWQVQWSAEIEKRLVIPIE